MCPVAYGGAPKKYAWKDHDTDVVNEAPPIQNQWYTVFDADDVRLLVCAVQADDVLAAGSTVEVRWTLDGDVYMLILAATSGSQYYIYRDKYVAGSGTELASTTEPCLAMLFYADKRALHAKIEVRKTSACLATDTLLAWCVRETLEET